MNLGALHLGEEDESRKINYPPYNYYKVEFFLWSVLKIENSILTDEPKKISLLYRIVFFGQSNIIIYKFGFNWCMFDSLNADIQMTLTNLLIFFIKK